MSRIKNVICRTEIYKEQPNKHIKARIILYTPSTKALSSVKKLSDIVPAKMAYYIKISPSEQALQLILCPRTSCISWSCEVPSWKPSFLPHQLAFQALQLSWQWGYSGKASWADSPHSLSIYPWQVPFSLLLFSSFSPLRAPFRINWTYTLQHTSWYSNESRSDNQTFFAFTEKKYPLLFLCEISPGNHWILKICQSRLEMETLSQVLLVNSTLLIYYHLLIYIQVFLNTWWIPG